MLGVARLNLAMSTRSLTVLKGAAEAALNVPAAREAYETRGRKAAMAKLTGVRTRVVDGNTERGKVSVQRVVSLSPPGSRVAGAVVKKKRVQRSGRPTGWPQNKETAAPAPLGSRERASRCCAHRWGGPLLPNFCNGQGLRHPLYPTRPLRLTSATIAPASTF